MGRAMVREPAAFLLDEPLSNLDAKLRAQMRTEIARLQRRLGTTMIYVTHDQAEAMTLGDHIAVLRRGSLQQVGTPRELYMEPRNLFVAGFIGSPPTNFLPAEVRGDRLVLPMAELPLPEGLRSRPNRHPEGFIAGIRPEDFQLVEDSPESEQGESGPTFQASVELVEWTGAESYVYFEVDAGGTGGTEGMAAISKKLRGLTRDLEVEAPGDGKRRLTARLQSGSPAVEGGSLRLRIDPDWLLLFDPETGERVGGDSLTSPGTAPESKRT